MGIRKIQITRKMEEIIKSYLFRGRYPTFQTITHQFGQWLRDHTPGAPVFNPMKVFRREKSSSEKYNTHISQIHQDISDAYEATIGQTTQIMSDFNFIETEREKLLHELANVSNDIDELLLMSSYADSREFNSYTVGFESAANINKSISTAFVDVKNKEVTLAENLMQSNKIIIDSSKASFQTLQPSNKQVALESIQNAFDDSLNTAWWHVVKTKELGANNIMRAELIVMLDQVEDINCIEYTPHHGKPVDIKLEYSNDGVSFTPIYQQAQIDKITGIKVWNFQKTSAKSIKFVFEKPDYDERSGNFYNYYFGAKNISIFKRSYVSQGVLYTNPIIFEKNVQQVSMFARHDIPFNTNLTYEIALNEEGKNPEELIWHPISSFDETSPKHAKVVSLSAKESKKVEASHAEPTGQTINGMQVFRLVKDNGEGVMSEAILDAATGESKETFDTFENARLFRGINQWKRERTYVKFDGSLPLSSKWDDQYRNRPQAIRVDYLPKGNNLSLYREGGGLDDNFYRFSICVYSDEEKTQPLSLSVVSTLSSGTRKRLGSYSVYVNRQRLAPVNDEVTMPFIKGWNEIQILFHWGDMQERKDVSRANLPTQTIVGKFNFAKEQKVRGDYDPMQFVDVHSLYHNISASNKGYFTIHERQILLNYLPKECIFQLVYETNQKAIMHNQLVLRAFLSRDVATNHVTPKISGIRLQAK